ncbi:trp operon leader peptide [Streptomyces sp. SID7805]|nr:trp operon leader peptide [Streptomyces sp. SID7805]
MPRSRSSRTPPICPTSNSPPPSTRYWPIFWPVCVRPPPRRRASGKVPLMYAQPVMSMNWWWTAHPAAH